MFCLEMEIIWNNIIIYKEYTHWIEYFPKQKFLSSADLIEFLGGGGGQGGLTKVYILHIFCQILDKIYNLQQEKFQISLQIYNNFGIFVVDSTQNFGPNQQSK